MLINKPCCDFKMCKHQFDGNCMNETEYEICSYNRQKAEIEKKDIEIDILIRKKETLRDEISELRAENERWKRIAYSLNEDRPNVGVEAIKEFAERVKGEICDSFGFVRHGKRDIDIDNLVKELTHEPTKIEHNSLCETETYESR